MKTTVRRDDDLDLESFIATIPSAEKIRARMKTNADETSVLRKLLRLAVTKEQAAKGGAE
ncbi:MAG: hypothetical protein O3A84_09455 [Proteobacteria bacterium]|nr:hypothetical protein [Pseudomonadota bacterium]